MYFDFEGEWVDIFDSASTGDGKHLYCLPDQFLNFSEGSPHFVTEASRGEVFCGVSFFRRDGGGKFNSIGSVSLKEVAHRFVSSEDVVRNPIVIEET